MAQQSAGTYEPLPEKLTSLCYFGIQHYIAFPGLSHSNRYLSHERYLNIIKIRFYQMVVWDQWTVDGEIHNQVPNI